MKMMKNNYRIGFFKGYKALKFEFINFINFKVFTKLNYQFLMLLFWALATLLLSVSPLGLRLTVHFRQICSNFNWEC